MKQFPRRILLTAAAILIAGAASFSATYYLLPATYSVLAQTFTGPNCSAGQCPGAIAVDSSNNLAIGTTTVLSDTRLFIKGGNSTSTAFAIQLKNQEGRPMFVVRNDGRTVIGPYPIGAPPSIANSASTLLVRGLIETVDSTDPNRGGGIRFPDGTTQTTAAVGGATMSAANVSFGAFGSNTGGGNYSFPASLGVGTTTPSRNLHIHGTAAAIFTNGTTGSAATDGFQIIQSGLTAYLEQQEAASLILRTSAADRMVIDSAGNVGIGTAAPATRLHVHTTEAINSQAVFSNAGTYHTGLSFTSTSNHLGDAAAWGIYGGPNTYLTGLAYRVGLVLPSSVPDFSILTGSANLNTQGTPRFTVTQAGNVGIGTTTPVSTLTVNGVIRSSKNSNAALVLEDRTTTGSSWTNYSDNGTLRFYNTTDRVVIDSSGNLGIGTTAPANLVSAIGTSAKSIEVKNTTNVVAGTVLGSLIFTGGSPSYSDAVESANPGAVIRAVGDGTWGGTLPTALTFSTTKSDTANFAERMRIDNAGNVGIGTTAPANKFHIIADTSGTFNAQASAGLRIDNTTSLNDTALLAGVDGAANIAYIQGVEPGFSWVTRALSLQPNGGYVGIGTTTPGYPLHVAGVIHSSTGGFRFPDGTVQTSAASAGTSTTVSAANVSSGSFGSNTGGGNYTFPALVTAANYSLTGAYPYLVAAPTAWGASAYYQVGIDPTGATTGNYAGFLLPSGKGMSWKVGTTVIGALDGTGLALGHSSPAYKLHVSDTSATVFTKATATGGIAANAVENNTAGHSIYVTAQGTTVAGTQFGITTADSGQIYTNNMPLAIGPYGNYNLTLGTNNAARVTILGSNGNVGIGTASPNSQAGLTIDKSNGGLYVARTQSWIDYNASAQNYLGGTTYFRTAGAGAINALIDGTGSANTYLAAVGGNVGIGTTTPTSLLSVGTTTTGLVATFGGGTGKINVGTIDPLYTIGGKRYATYLPAMTGQKEETTGVLKLENCKIGNCKLEINFGNLAEGSDLWLFAKTTNIERDRSNFEAMTVMLTPAFDGRAWYERNIEKRTLVINGAPSTKNQEPSTVEVSYRLTAPRFDAAQWSNRATETDEGFNLDKLLK